MMKLTVTKQSVKKFNNLISRMAKKSKYALEEFHAEYCGFIYSVAYPIVNSHCIAEEIVNDVLVKVWQFANHNAPIIENHISWLYIVTANCAKARIKKEKYSSKIFDIPQEDKNIEEFMETDAFLSDISSLNEEEQRILILYYIFGFTFRKIGIQIGKRTSSVSSIYYRAIKKLKKILK